MLSSNGLRLTAVPAKTRIWIQTTPGKLFLFSGVLVVLHSMAHNSFLSSTRKSTDSSEQVHMLRPAPQMIFASGQQINKFCTPKSTARRVYCSSTAILTCEAYQMP